MLEVVETAIEEETLQALLSLVLQKLSSCSSCVLGYHQTIRLRWCYPAHFAAASGQVSETILCTTHRVHNLCTLTSGWLFGSGYWIMVGLQKTETTLEGLLYMMLPNRAR